MKLFGKQFQYELQSKKVETEGIL